MSDFAVYAFWVLIIFSNSVVVSADRIVKISFLSNGSSALVGLLFFSNIYPHLLNIQNIIIRMFSWSIFLMNMYFWVLVSFRRTQVAQGSESVSLLLPSYVVRVYLYFSRANLTCSTNELIIEWTNYVLLLLKEPCFLHGDRSAINIICLVYCCLIIILTIQYLLHSLNAKL